MSVDLVTDTAETFVLIDILLLFNDRFFNSCKFHDEESFFHHWIPFHAEVKLHKLQAIYNNFSKINKAKSFHARGLSFVAGINESLCFSWRSWLQW